MFDNEYRRLLPRELENRAARGARIFDVSDEHVARDAKLFEMISFYEDLLRHKIKLKEMENGPP